MVSINREFIYKNTYFHINKMKCDENKYSDEGRFKKNIVYLIDSVAVVASILIETIISPVNAVIYKWRIEKVVRSQSNRKNPELLTKIKESLEELIRKRGLSLSEAQKKSYCAKAAAVYRSSQKNYGGVVLLWVVSLMNEANEGNKKLIFMARDGSAPYELAKRLRTRFPDKYQGLQEDSIQLAYFSRNVIKSLQEKSGQNLFNDYIENELHIKTSDSCIFVDIGFAGSMIEPLRKLMGDKAKNLEFRYLISHTEKAGGFLKLKSVQSAMANIAVHWIEDTHQGVIRSPQKLVRIGGHVYPDTNVPGAPLVYEDSLEYFIRQWGYQAIVDMAEKSDENNTIQTIDTIQKAFDKMLKRIQRGKDFLMISHEEDIIVDAWRKLKNVGRRVIDLTPHKKR